MHISNHAASDCRSGGLHFRHKISALFMRAAGFLAIPLGARAAATASTPPTVAPIADEILTKRAVF
jgi:hypothetical protein